MSKQIKAKKPKVIQKHQIHDKDSGSPEVQIAVLTEEIKNLTAHLLGNHKDHSSRRGLLRKVGRRKKLLNYLLGEDKIRYFKTCKKNGIKPNLLPEDINNINKTNEVATPEKQVETEVADKDTAKA